MDVDWTKRAIEIAKELGADEVEVFYGKTITRSITIEKNIVKPYVSKLEGIAFRVAKNKNISFSYTYDLTEDNIREAIKIAIKSAELKGADEKYAGFPNYNSITSENIVDEIRDVSMDEINQLLEKAYSEVRKIKNTVPIGGGAEYLEGYYRIVNTNGVDSVLAGNALMFSVYVLTKEIPPNFAYGFTLSRKKDINIEEIIGPIERRVKRILGATEMKYHGEPELVISPMALFQLLFAFLNQIDASQVIAGMSPYSKETIGKKIISDKISIIDDPFHEKALVKAKVDFEGVPTKTKPLVKDGVLKTILNDYYHAKALDIEPSANALRVSMWGNQDPVMTEVNIMPWFLTVEGKEQSFEDIINSINDGFIIEDVMGVHQADPVSGKFAVPALAVRIKNGRIAKPIRKIMLSGTIGQLLNNVEVISREREYLQIGLFPYVKTKGPLVSAEKSPLGYRLSMKMANLLLRLGIIKF